MKEPCSKCRKSHDRDEMYWVLPPVLPRGDRKKAVFVCVECW